jgi:hypothetical protein
MLFHDVLEHKWVLHLECRYVLEAHSVRNMNVLCCCSFLHEDC